MSVQYRLLIQGTETTEADPALAPEALWGYLGVPGRPLRPSQPSTMQSSEEVTIQDLTAIYQYKILHPLPKVSSSVEWR